MTTRHFIYHICLCYSQQIRYITIWHVVSKALNIYMEMVTHGPTPGKRHWIYSAPATRRSASNILPFYLTYILTGYCVQPHFHTIRLWSRERVPAIAQNSIFQLSDMCCSRGHMSFTTAVKEWHNWQKMNSLHVHSTINRAICLIRMLQVINCAWQVYIRALKTNDLLLAE
jgi:hypothetical protein